MSTIIAKANKLDESNWVKPWARPGGPAKEWCIEPNWQLSSRLETIIKP